MESIFECVKKESDYMKKYNLLKDIKQKFNNLYNETLTKINDDQVKHILERPQWKQRTPEWHKQRSLALTASSDISSLISNSYKALVNKKCGVGKKFKGNIHTYHGQKFEDVAIAIYSSRYEKHVHNVGFLKHETNSLLGASPDGLTDDCKLLEIKVPSARFIDGVVKKCYFVQMQTQMQVCNVALCDFFECTIKYYNSQEDYEKDAFTKEVGNSLVKVHKDRRRANGLEKGVIGRIGWREADESNIYEYPPFEYTTTQQLKWLNKKKDQYKKQKLDLKFDFWYLDNSSLTTVERDDEWWEEHNLNKKIKTVCDLIKTTKQNKNCIDPNDLQKIHTMFSSTIKTRKKKPKTNTKTKQKKKRIKPKQNSKKTVNNFNLKNHLEPSNENIWSHME